MRALETLRGWQITPRITYFSHPAEMGTTTFNNRPKILACVYTYVFNILHEPAIQFLHQNLVSLIYTQFNHFDNDIGQILTAPGRLHSWTSVKDHAAVPKRGARVNRFS